MSEEGLSFGNTKPGRSDARTIVPADEFDTNAAILRDIQGGAMESDFRLDTIPKTLRCPVGIEALLWYHCRCEPLRDSPANRDWTDALSILELIMKDHRSGSGYRTTTKGRKLVQRLCAVPIAEQGATDE